MVSKTLCSCRGGYLTLFGNGLIGVALVFGAEEGIDAGRNDEVILVKAVDGVSENSDAESSPAYKKVGVMLLALRDFTYPVRQGK
jgi:hypothetical protein